jgi:hypothetical protein
MKTEERLRLLEVENLYHDLNMRLTLAQESILTIRTKQSKDIKHYPVDEADAAKMLISADELGRPEKRIGISFTVKQASAINPALWGAVGLLDFVKTGNVKDVKVLEVQELLTRKLKHTPMFRPWTRRQATKEGGSI